MKSRDKSSTSQPRGLDEALASLSPLGTGPRAEWEKRAIEAKLFGEEPPTERVGRFRVLERIGRGGMGEVFAAYDEELDRKVAIKVMAGRTTESSVQRFAREGRALARLSHPNIVPVHEVGQHEGAMFIAMEFIEGRTLAEWMKDGTRSWKAIVAVLLEAGRGLAAAHAAGLIHRDFKPENVMVGDDGRVRVLDFGLARGLETTPSQASTHRSAARATATHDSSAALATPPSDVTTTGAMLGTPAYMAPEQHVGQSATAASDQFSFCVTAFEALHGVRPFPGRNRAAIFEAMQRGQVYQVARGGPGGLSRVPARVRRALLRGLSLGPRERWPSMDALILELEGALHPRRWPLTALALAGAGLGGLGLWQQSTDARRCQDAGAGVQEIWNDGSRQRLNAALVATAGDFGQSTWTRLQPRLDAYARQWRHAATEVCEATHVRNVQSETVLDLRMACLNRRLGDLDESIEVLSGIDQDGVARAIEVVDALPRLARCDDVEDLQSRTPPPRDSAVAAEVEVLRQRLSRSRALEKAAQYDEASTEADGVVQRAEQLGYAPLLAEALLRRGTIRDRQARYDEALLDFERAYLLAVEHEQQGVEAEALVRLTFAVGVRGVDVEAGLRYGKTALAVARRRRTDSALRAMAHDVYGSVLETAGRHDEALAYVQQALEVRQSTLGSEHLTVSSSLTHLGSLLWNLGRRDEALEQMQRAREIEERVVGPDHPGVANVLRRMGTLLAQMGRSAEGLELLEHALAIFESSLGPRHPDVAYTHNSLGRVLHDSNRLDEALVHFRAALPILEASLGPDHPDLDKALTSLGILLTEMDELDEALMVNRRALDLRERTRSPDDPGIAISSIMVGAVLRKMGQSEDARDHVQRGLELLETKFGPEHDSLIVPLLDLARIELAQGAPGTARIHVERAIALLDAAPLYRGPRAPYHFVLARALWADPMERKRARELAVQAREEWAAQPEHYAGELAEIEAWLDEHGGR